MPVAIIDVTFKRNKIAKEIDNDLYWYDSVDKAMRKFNGSTLVYEFVPFEFKGEQLEVYADGLGWIDGKTVVTVKTQKKWINGKATYVKESGVAYKDSDNYQDIVDWYQNNRDELELQALNLEVAAVGVLFPLSKQSDVEDSLIGSRLGTLYMLRVKIADNTFSQQQGLMFVDDLPDNEGMLFIFRRANRLSFWGLNTLIPLDIAFIDEKNKIQKISNIEVESLKQVSCDIPCKFAIETNRGWFERNDICVGDTFNIDDDEVHIVAGINFSDPNYGIVSFNKGDHKDLEKDLPKQYQKIKESQTLPPNKVEKPGEQAQGAPITENVNNVELPVLDVSNLGSMLEDSHDPEDQMGQPQDDMNPAAPEQPNPEEQPQDPNEQEQPEKDYPVFSSSYQATEWAEQNNEVMRISYTTKHGRALIRDVEPHGSFHSKSTSKDILVTFDETINDIRAFIMGNISKWAFVGKKFDKKFVVKG